MNKINPLDTISGAEAECYITLDGKRYHAMTLKNLEAKSEKIKVEVPILGSRSKGNKTVGVKHTGSATSYYVTSIFRQAMYKYEKTGVDTNIEIVVTNDDPTSTAGKQTVSLLGVNIDSTVLTKFDVDADEFLEEDFDFTFEDWEMPDKFNLLDGMEG
jgi:hypothetical protein